MLHREDTTPASASYLSMRRLVTTTKIYSRKLLWFFLGVGVGGLYFFRPTASLVCACVGLQTQSSARSEDAHVHLALMVYLALWSRA